MPRNSLQRSPDKVLGFVWLGVSATCTSLCARKIQQLADESIEAIGLLFDHRGSYISSLHDLVGQRLDRGQWSPQIVRDGRKQRVLETVRLTQRPGVIRFT